MTETELVGAWRLVSMIHTPEAGKPFHPFGARPTGLLLYTPDGMMSVTIRSADGAKVLAYAGPYRRDGERVIHDVEISTRPEWIGSRQERIVDLRGDDLTLRTDPFKTDGETTKLAEIRWRRA